MCKDQSTLHCCATAAPTPGSSAVCLLQICFVGIVVEGEAEREILAAELRRKRREWIRRGNASPRSAIQRAIAGCAHQPHSSDGTIFCDRELDGNFAFLHQRRASRL